MAVTSKTIAKRLGINQSTVSRALKGQSVSKETIERVRQMAEELGYRPNVGAQIMASGRTGMYGLLIPTATNPFCGRVIDGIQAKAMRDGFYVAVGAYQVNIDEFKRYLDLFVRERRVDGLIVFPMHDPRVLEALAAVATEDMPIVLMGKTLIHGIHVVDSDHEAAGHEIAMHLLDHGHKRIGVVMGMLNADLAQVAMQTDTRVIGMHQAMLERGIMPQPDMVVNCESTLEGGYRAAMDLLQRTPRPTAIAAVNDLLAMGVISAAQKLGLRIPDDLSVTGYDNIELAQFFNLTTINNLTPDLIDAPLSFLHEVLERGFKATGRMTACTRPQLIVRGSTGPARD